MTLEDLLILLDFFVSTDYLLGKSNIKRELEEQSVILDELQEKYKLSLNINCFERGDRLVEKVEDGIQFDIIFLDIQITGLEGMFLRYLSDERLPNLAEGIH